MVEYFKNDKAMFEFAILYMDTITRDKMLGLTLKKRCDKMELAKWYRDILDKIEDPEAIDEFNCIMYTIM